MKKEIGFEIIVENKFPNNDIETDENKWNVKLVFYGNDKEHAFNANIYNILKELSDNLFDFESYSITKEQFDSMKNKSVEYYSIPLTQKEFEELLRDEILKKRIEYLKEIICYKMSNDKRGKNMLSYILKDNTKNVLQKFSMKFEIPKQELQKINQRIPTKLYRYCSLNEYSLHNLLSNELTGNSPEVFNDLYDATIHRNSSQFVRKRFDDLNQMSKKLGFDPVEMPEENIIHIENNTKKSDRFYMRYMTEPFRIVSLSESNNSILMWSHYADMNRGICIEYDFSHDPLYQKTIFPILYLDNPIDMSFLKVEKSENELMNSILLSAITKYKIWSYEKEWRYLFYMITPKKFPERIPLINMPTPTAIYLGRNFINKWEKEKNRDLFYKFCDYIKSEKIDLYIMNNKILSYELNPEKITLNELIKLHDYEIEGKFLE